MILREINLLLNPLIKEIKRARQLDLQIQSLEEQVALAKGKLSELGYVMNKEEDDFIRLQNRRLPVRSKKWEKEEAEFRYAKHEYEEALYMAGHMNQLLRILKDQRSKIGDPEKLRAELLRVKEQTIIEQKHPALPLLIEKEEKILELEAELTEVKEAEEAVQSIFARVDHLFRILMRMDSAGGALRTTVWWFGERRKYQHTIEEAAFEVHQANHKLLRELVDLKRTYTIANGNRMKDFYNIFLGRLKAVREDLDDQVKVGKNLCRGQVQIVQEVNRRLLTHKKELQTQINMFRSSQQRIVEHA